MSLVSSFDWLIAWAGGLTINAPSEVKKGAMLEMTCELTGRAAQPPATIRWYYRGRMMMEGPTFR